MLTYCPMTVPLAYLFTAEFDLVVSQHFLGPRSAPIPQTLLWRSKQFAETGQQLLASVSEPPEEFLSYLANFQSEWKFAHGLGQVPDADKSNTVDALDPSPYAALGADSWGYIWIPSSGVHRLLDMFHRGDAVFGLCYALGVGFL